MDTWGTKDAVGKATCSLLVEPEVAFLGLHGPQVTSGKYLQSHPGILWGPSYASLYLWSRWMDAASPLQGDQGWSLRRYGRPTVSSSFCNQKYSVCVHSYFHSSLSLPPSSLTHSHTIKAAVSSFFTRLPHCQIKMSVLHSSFQYTPMRKSIFLKRQFCSNSYGH